MIILTGVLDFPDLQKYQKGSARLGYFNNSCSTEKQWAVMKKPESAQLSSVT